ncbi:phage head morphogenesis protein [Neisseria musculi]|uniref:phage head morphogenesis protein n=1 Tax=Neisseria musculi TaxID=1815583 RepID=UPI001FE8F387|nr:phage minor head protein [Neisseria musculi]
MSERRGDNDEEHRHPPYWEYAAIKDGRTRESHRLLHGKVYAATDPVWDTRYPPLDYRCRCRVKPLSEARGAAKVLPSPKLETITVDIRTNEYTGEERYAQRTGIRINGTFVAPNAGFNANQGKAMLSRMARVAAEKARAVHPDIARTAMKELAADKRFKNSLPKAVLAWVLDLLKG